MQNVLKEVPDEINMCTSIVTDVVSWVMSLISAVSFTLLLSNLQVQAMTIMMGVMAKGTDIGVAFAAHDFYRMGEDIGGIVN